MLSLYDELDEKMKRESGATRRVGPRQDMGLLLFSFRESIRRLWAAADIVAARRAVSAQADSDGKTAALQELAEALDDLRPLFGERQDVPGV